MKTINADADLTHGMFTASVHALIEIGAPAIPAMLDVMVDGDWSTRLHAQFVLEMITSKMRGFVPGHGWPDRHLERDDEFRAFWRSLGDLDFEAPKEERVKAVTLWREWYGKNAHNVQDKKGVLTVPTP